jgi:hypothetical protein
MTLTAAQARDRSRAEAVYLADIQLLAGGPLLRLSDRNITVAAGAYCDYLSSISGVGDTLYRATAAFESAQIALVFRNDPYSPYACLSALVDAYPIEGAAVTLSQCFLDDDGTPTTPEVIFIGNLDSPAGITGISFSCAAVCREAWAAQVNK